MGMPAVSNTSFGPWFTISKVNFASVSGSAMLELCTASTPSCAIDPLVPSKHKNFPLRLRCSWDLPRINDPGWSL